MNEGSLPLRPLWPGSMPTVIPASGAADGCVLARGAGLLAAEARKAAGEAATSPAAAGPEPACLDPACPVPPGPVAELAQAVTRQADSTQGRIASRPARLARVRPVLPVRSRGGSLSSAAERVDVLNLPPAALAEGRDREHGAGVASLAGARPGVLLVGEDEQPGPVAVEHLHSGVGDLGGDDQLLRRRVFGHQREQGVVLAHGRPGQQALRGPPRRRGVRVVVGEDRVDRGGDLAPDRGGRGPVGERRVLRGGTAALAVGVHRGPHPEPAEDDGGGAERGGYPPRPAPVWRGLLSRGGLFGWGALFSGRGVLGWDALPGRGGVFGRG